MTGSTLILPATPDHIEKNSYAWRSLPYLTTSLTISSLCIITAQLWLEAKYVIASPFAVYTVLYLAYQAVSLPVNFMGHSFDLTAHKLRVAAWSPQQFPSVDIYLPICGEPTEVLCNTWEGVLELIHAYPGMAEPYVLDDGDSDQARNQASLFGFTYVRRPVHAHKKSGNLNYAFSRTNGEHIVIFDADFRPRPDFLAESLPYMDDPAVGIVQTPQFFRSDPGQAWVERAAGATLEIFYRAVQVSRNRLGSALCVGSNAVYRRRALEPSGGFTMIPYAEDSHTGLDMRYHGYQLVYIPIVLAAGVCPATVDAFMRQQYRWCCGATSLVWTNHMWRVPMPWQSRLPYIAGWLWNLTTAMRTLIIPLIPVVVLTFLPEEVLLRNVVLLIPAVVVGTVLYPLWHNVRWAAGIWPLAIAVGWAQAFALWDYARGKVMSWQPSRSPKDATRRFRTALISWNGSLTVAWLGLAVWRITETGAMRFAPALAFGLVNAAVITRITFPGKKAS